MGDQERLINRLLASELRATLKRWGDWIDRHLSVSGLPNQVAFLNIPSSARAGHRILCLEMEPKVAAVSRAIVRLEDAHQAALTTWYAHQWDAEGRWLSPSQKAQMMGITFDQFRWRVYCSRRELMRMKRFWAI